MASPIGGDETGPDLITAIAEIGSSVSRNPPRRRHLVRLCAPGQSVIVAGGLSETGAQRVAEAINDFLAEVLYQPPPEPAACPQCATALQRSEQGRPALYCSPACRQQAYRDRRPG
jgi:tRNA(Ile2) C34 agmatinyltransferase TiaS